MGRRNDAGWILRFSRRLAEAAGPAERVLVLREAEAALARLSEKELRAERESARRERVDPELEEWLLGRLESPGGRAYRRTQAFFEHLHGVHLVQERGAALEEGIAHIEHALAQVSRAEGPEDWSQMQHNLAEALMQHEGGARTDNVERAVAAFRAALPGRRGLQRVDTLLGLAQALRQWRGGDPGENIENGERALNEAERLLAHDPDRRRGVRLILERASWLYHRGSFEAAHSLVCRAIEESADPEQRWHARDREATLLCAWAEQAPERRAEAVALNRALLSDAHVQQRWRSMAGVRSRLRALGEPLPPIGQETIEQLDVHWWIHDLGSAPLAEPLLRALDLRARREAQDAFQIMSGRALVRREVEIAPLLFRMAIEFERGGDVGKAVGCLAQLGAWPLRRALLWTDMSTSPMVDRVRWSRILEDRLTEVLVWSATLEAHGLPAPPIPPGVSDVLQRYLAGATDNAFPTADDLLPLLVMPPQARSSAAAELYRGIESGIGEIFQQIGSVSEALRRSLVTPPLMPIGRFSETVQPGQAIVLLVRIRDERALGSLWRKADGGVVARLIRAPTGGTADGVVDDASFAEELSALAAEMAREQIERVAVVSRGLYARRAVLVIAPLFDAGARVVHLPGVDRVALPPLDRARTERLLVLIGPEPQAQLPCISAVATTIERAGFKIVRSGEAISAEVAARMTRVRSLILAGHGHGALGALRATIGAYPVTYLDQLPLLGSEWGICMACATGDSGSNEDLFWDRDDPAGAAEHLLLAGCRSAADCITPVPEVLGALLIEELAVRAAGGEDIERAFAATCVSWQTFWRDLITPLAEEIVAGRAMEQRSLAAWLTSRIDAERQRRLGQGVVPLPPDGLFQPLGVRPPAGPWANATSAPELKWALKLAERVLEPLTARQTWAAFRWMARR